MEDVPPAKRQRVNFSTNQSANTNAKAVNQTQQITNNIQTTWYIIISTGVAGHPRDTIQSKRSKADIIERTTLLNNKNIPNDNQRPVFITDYNPTSALISKILKKELFADIYYQRDTPVASHFHLPRHSSRNLDYQIIKQLGTNPDLSHYTTNRRSIELHWTLN